MTFGYVTIYFAWLQLLILLDRSRHATRIPLHTERAE